MAYLQADDIADMIKTTQRDLGRMKWTDISYNLQEYIALPMILQREKVSFQSGYGIQCGAGRKKRHKLARQMSKRNPHGSKTTFRYLLLRHNC